jgi:hypothetical protein
METLVRDRRHRCDVVTLEPSFVLRLSQANYARLSAMTPSVPHGACLHVPPRVVSVVSVMVS